MFCAPHRRFWEITTVYRIHARLYDASSEAAAAPIHLFFPYGHLRHGDLKRADLTVERFDDAG